MTESGSVAVLGAEVRVVQVGNGQLTRAMYWQLDEAVPKQFEPFGRVKDNKFKLKDGVLLVGRDGKTGALVRYHTQPPHWSPRQGPKEFTHWMEHWARPRKDQLPPRIRGRQVQGVCPSLDGGYHRRLRCSAVLARPR